MNHEEAIKIIEPIIHAIDRLKFDSSYYQTLLKDHRILNEELRKQEKIITELASFRRKFQLIEKVSDVMICTQCDGTKGGMEGDEYSGFDYWECDKCQGQGIISKNTTTP